MARMMMTLLVALTAGWCASTVGVAHVHDEQSVRAAAAPRPTTMSHARVGRPAAARVARASAGCPQTNAFLGLPYLNLYANGNCGYYIGGTVLSTGSLLFPSHAMTLYQEGPVSIAPKAAFTLASGSTLIMRGGSELYVNGTLVVQPGVTFRVGGGSITVIGTGASLRMQGTPSHPIVLTGATATAGPGS